MKRIGKTKNNYWKNKKVLVTGAGGFIGSRMTEVLAQKGAHVKAVYSPNTDLRKVAHKKNIEAVKADLLNYDDCIRVTREQKIILHFAAVDGNVLFKRKYPAEILAQNAQLGFNILNSSKEAKIDRILIMSSTEVYSKTGLSIVDEESELINSIENSSQSYGWSKRVLEVAAKTYFMQYGLKVAIARAGNVYGPGDTHDPEKGRVVATFMYKALKGEDISILSDGSQMRSFLYIDDLIDSLLNLVEEFPNAEPINIVGSSKISIKDLALMIKNKIESKTSLVFIKSKIERRENIQTVSNKKAKNLSIMVERIPFEKGIDKTVEYFKRIYEGK